MTSKRPLSPTRSLTDKFASLNISRDTVAMAKDETSEASGHCEKHSNSPRVDYFHGDRAKLRAYLVQLKLAFALNKEKYPDAATKVLFAAAYLRDSAFAWFEPYVSD